ncbi:hypothetical protein TcG_12123, partial [Trypanosoma cruzi]
KKRDAITSISAMIEELSDGTARTDRTNLSLRDTAWSMIKPHPQEGVLRSARFAFFPQGCVTTVRIMKHLDFPQCHIAFRPCNAYIIDPYVDTDQWRCGPEAVNHHRHHRDCRSNNLENFWAADPDACAARDNVPSSTRHRKRCRVSRGKETMKDAFISRQETASAITGGK